MAVPGSVRSAAAAGVNQLLADGCTPVRDAGDVLWSLLNLEIWYRTWIDNGGIQHLDAPAPAGAGVPGPGASPVPTTA